MAGPREEGGASYLNSTVPLPTGNPSQELGSALSYLVGLCLRSIWSPLCQSLVQQLQLLDRMLQASIMKSKKE